MNISDLPTSKLELLFQICGNPDDMNELIARTPRPFDPIMDYAIDYRDDFGKTFPDETRSTLRRFERLYKEVVGNLQVNVGKMKKEKKYSVPYLRHRMNAYSDILKRDKCKKILYHLRTQLPQGPKVSKVSDRVTNEDIATARHFPLENLMETFRGGHNKLKAICPFHEDKKPSLDISTDKNLWYCFVCCEGGDVIKYVMKLEGLEFREAVRRLL